MREPFQMVAARYVGEEYFFYENTSLGSYRIDRDQRM
jgi:hypothetical protein